MPCQIKSEELAAKLKAGEPVYVGRSSQGLRRVFNRHHKAQAFLGADLMVWCTGSTEDMKNLEVLLIEGLMPTLNDRQQGRAQRLADLMGVSISRARTLAQESK